jgi:hypothetical protein
MNSMFRMALLYESLPCPQLLESGARFARLISQRLPVITAVFFLFLVDSIYKGKPVP